MECDICGGARVIRLPIKRRMSVMALREISPTVAMEDVARTYPCPECAETVALDRVAVIERCSLVDARIGDPEFIEYARRHAAQHLAASLAEGGFIAFRRGKPDDMQMTVELRATVGVVSPKIVATLEERIAARQADVALRAAEIATAGIANWGSHYGDRSIPKDVARSEIREAVTRAIAER